MGNADSKPDELIPYKGNLDWLVPRTILYVVHGSRAYGTCTPTSDYDFKGVAVPPRSWRDSYLVSKRNWSQVQIPEPDATIFSLTRFFELAADCNPNIIEVLWVEDEDVKLSTPAGDRLREHRAAFLSKAASYRFRGYAMSQLKRIRTHRQWLLNPPKGRPVRADYGLPDVPLHQVNEALAMVRKRIDSWSIDFGDVAESVKISILEGVETWMSELSIGEDEKFQAACRLIGFEDNLQAMLDKERQYKNDLTHWKNYERWKAERNEARAKLEADFGFDTKHGMHLVRLMRMCREILTEGIVRVRRPDAQELLAIRKGAWSYDRLMEWAEIQDTELQALAETTSLLNRPNAKVLDQLHQQILDMLPAQ